MPLDINKKHHYYFKELTKIPHGSFHEEKVSNWIRGFAEERGLRFFQDDMYNIIVYKDGSKGREDLAPIILQGHMDMVQEANKGTKIDFMKDPLTLIEDGDWLHADGTTLGADDGVAVAYMLAILDDDSMPHPPLECAFTVREEVGLVGANHLRAEYFTAKRMVCLDSSGETTTVVSTAGGERVNTRFEPDTEENGDRAYSLFVSGLLGGHSGELIATGRANSIKIAGRIAKELQLKGIDLRIVSVDGGLKENAIPRECEIVFASGSPYDDIRKVFEKSRDEITNEIEGFEKTFSATLSERETAGVCFDADSSRKLLDFIFLVPNGFMEKSAYIKGLTATSLNLGSVKTEGSTVKFVSSLRSMFDSAKKDLEHHVMYLAEMLGGVCDTYGIYGGWSYCPDSSIRESLRKSVKKITGKELVEVSVHAGDECGVFAGLGVSDIVAIGPIMEDIHTPKERLSMSSFDTSFEILKDLLASLD